MHSPILKDEEEFEQPEIAIKIKKKDILKSLFIMEER
jgi:hypothetical protein